MVDIFSPPVAARMYAYANVASYEVLVNKKSDYRSLKGEAKYFTGIPAPEKNLQYDFNLASAVSSCTVARMVVYSEFEFDNFEKLLLDSAKIMSIDEKIISNSKQYGKQAGSTILIWMRNDNFATHVNQHDMCCSISPEVGHLLRPIIWMQ
jgi:hypothetical protein